jgi:hypothetical protein
MFILFVQYVSEIMVMDTKMSFMYMCIHIHIQIGTSQFFLDHNEQVIMLSLKFRFVVKNR